MVLFIGIKQQATKRMLKQCIDESDLERENMKEDLQRLTKSKHQGVKFPCPQCDHKATQKGSLLTHIKSVHEGVKYPCKKCDFKATQKGNLLRHIKSTHEGVRYPCAPPKVVISPSCLVKDLVTL